MDNNLSRKTTLGYRLLSLLILSSLGLLISMVFVLVLDRLPKFDATLLMITVQDVMSFILPALLVMLNFYKKPWKQMGLDKVPSWQGVLMAVMVCIVAMPALNWIVDWNEHLHLPESMAVIETAMRDAEDAAQQMTQMLLNETSVFSLLCVLFVVGIMAGLSEEIFFRGAMLRMTASNGNSHLAIWVVAIVFSAIHMQFFGFFPRMLLGAWLGYLLMWTRSLWVPIIAHTLNNSIVALANYFVNVGVLDENFVERLGVPQDGSFPVLALASAVATAAIIAFFYDKVRRGQKQVLYKE